MRADLALRLPETGLIAHVATTLWVKTRPGDRRRTLVPDVHIPHGAADSGAGRDPVLERALG